LHGTKTVEFGGLKLARMSILKKVVCAQGLRPNECEFAIQFVCGSDSCTSEKFTIVSSFAQLPAEFQDQRPYKRTKPTSNKTTNEPSEERSSKQRKT